MTKFRGIRTRLGRAEDAGGPDTGPVPHVLFVKHGETRDAALGRFRAEYPVVPKRHGLLIAPERARDAERFAAEFKASQTKLVREARSVSERLLFAVTAPRVEPEVAAVKRAREVVAASKVSPTKPTFSAAQHLSRSLRASVNNPKPNDR